MLKKLFIWMQSSCGHAQHECRRLWNPFIFEILFIPSPDPDGDEPSAAALAYFTDESIVGYFYFCG
jgi:hypothetical protein